MRLTTGRLGLEIPVALQPANAKALCSESAMVKWRSDLPMANTAAATNATYRMLQQINASNIPHHLRFQFTEILYPPVQFLVKSLKKLLFSKCQDLIEEKNTLIDIITFLQLEICKSYKLFIENSKKNSFDNENLLLAMHRVFYVYSEILNNSYHFNCNAPENIWKEAHLLYKAAYKFNLHNKRLGPQTSVMSKRQSKIKSYYKHMLLLAAASNTNISLKELEKVDQALFQWVPLTSLVAKTNVGLNIAITQDAPFIKSEDNANDHSHLMLETYDILAKIKEIIADRTDELYDISKISLDVTSTIAVETLHALKDAWGGN